MSTKTFTKVYHWLKYAQYYILPGICIVCKQASKRHTDLCSRCEAELPVIKSACPRCALPIPKAVPTGTVCGSCLKHPPPFRQCCIPLAYDGVLRQLLSAFKHHDKLHIAKVLAPVISRFIKLEYTDESLPAMLIPVPLHIRRFRYRGYNQAQFLAKALGKELGLPVNDNLCIRTRDTGEQKVMNARHRRKNLRRAFSINHAGDLKHINRVAIVDDVVTTMNTAAELAHVIHRAGVPEIDLWAVGRTLRH